MDWKIELVVVPVTDVDRAKAFYADQVGFDHEVGTHGLDPHSYRQRYGLPSDYPMVAPNYAAQRSALAKSIGLGRPGGRLAEAEPPAEEPKTRGRRKVA